MLSGDAGTSQDSLLYGVQLLELRFYKLIKCFRDTQVSRFQRHVQNGSTASLCYLPLLHHVLEDGHHKESVAAGMTVEQCRKAGGKAPSFELEGQVFCDVRLLKAFKANFVTQVVDYELLLQCFKRALRNDHISGTVGSQRQQFRRSTTASQGGNEIERR